MSKKTKIEIEYIEPEADETKIEFTKLNGKVHSYGRSLPF